MSCRSGLPPSSAKGACRASRERSCDVFEVVPRTFYEHMEHSARRRVPRDLTTGRQFPLPLLLLLMLRS